MVDARAVTFALFGHSHGNHATAPCPVCQPEGRADQRALSISRGSDGRVLLCCFKGGCSYREIVAAVDLRSGGFAEVRSPLAERQSATPRPAATNYAAQAERLWNEALPIRGTLAETYLRSRAITCDLPATLRFHPDCWHGPTASRHPAMIARVQGAPAFAVHRTYLRWDGLGKAALAGGDKRMLGPTAGGAVRLSPLSDHLVVGEGVETALSMACGLMEGPATIWAALSAPGMRALRLPRLGGFGRLGTVRAALIIAVDGDAAGRGAGRDLAERAAGLGWLVSIADPGDGADWNDRLIGEGASHECV